MQMRGLAQATLAQPEQIYYKNSLDCLLKVLKQEGVPGLFRGVTASYLGIVEGMTQWVVYERLKTAVHQYRSQ